MKNQQIIFLHKEKFEVLCPKTFIPSKPNSREKERKGRIGRQRGVRVTGLNSTKLKRLTSNVNQITEGLTQTIEPVQSSPTNDFKI